MSSIEWADAQLCIIIDKRKQRNVKYHATSIRRNNFFEWKNMNYFTGKVVVNQTIFKHEGWYI